MTRKILKEIGDTTSITIPKSFTHTKSMERIDIDESHLNFISKSLGERKLVHAIFSAIHDYIHTENQTYDYSTKIDEILEHLKVLNSNNSIFYESPKNERKVTKNKTSKKTKRLLKNES